VHARANSWDDRVQILEAEFTSLAARQAGQLFKPAHDAS